MVHAQQSLPGPAPARTSKRPLWHWLVVGGVAVLGLLVVGVLALIITIQLLTRGNPQNTLEDFYTALADTDCELFMESTTEGYREATGLTSCAIFEEELGQFTSVDYEVNDRINRQGYAVFEVTETYSAGGEDTHVDLRYYVRRIDGQWDLDGIEVIDPGGDPLT